MQRLVEKGSYARFADYKCANTRVHLSFQNAPRPGTSITQYLCQFESDAPEDPLKYFFEVLGDRTPLALIAPLIGLMLRRNLGLIYAWPVLLNPFIDTQLGDAFIKGVGRHDAVTFLARHGYNIYDGHCETDATTARRKHWFPWEAKASTSLSPASRC